jgi:hypothetical protein
LANNIIVYEYVEDEVAQPVDTPDLPIEECLRQEVPRIFQSRLEAELNDVSESEGEATPLRDFEILFVQSLIDMIKETT